MWLRFSDVEILQDDILREFKDQLWCVFLRNTECAHQIHHIFLYLKHWTIHKLLIVHLLFISEISKRFIYILQNADILVFSSFINSTRLDETAARSRVLSVNELIESRESLRFCNSRKTFGANDINLNDRFSV